MNAQTCMHTHIKYTEGLVSRPSCVPEKWVLIKKPCIKNDMPIKKKLQINQSQRLTFRGLCTVIYSYNKINEMH